METSGVHAPGIRAPELRALAEQRGPVASVYLATPGNLERAGSASELRWSALRRSLADQGADRAALAHIDPLVEHAHERGACMAAFSGRDGLRHLEYHDEPLAGEVAAWDALPFVVPLLRWRQATVPYVFVLTDRRGADITVSAVGTDDAQRDVPPQTDASDRKVAPGGWSQRRYQQRAENTWDTNARAVAEAVRRAADDAAAEVIVVAGDVRAMELLQEHLDDRLAGRVREIPGGRAAGVDAEAMHAEVERWVRDASARATVETLERFREELGQHDRAADGVDATFDALNQSRVDVLLVHDEADDERRAHFGTAPIPIATRAEALASDFGITDVQSSRVIEVAVRAALGTGAGVRVVPKAGGPRDGVGAILRWS